MRESQSYELCGLFQTALSYAYCTSKFRLQTLLSLSSSELKTHTLKLNVPTSKQNQCSCLVFSFSVPVKFREENKHIYFLRLAYKKNKFIEVLVTVSITLHVKTELACFWRHYCSYYYYYFIKYWNNRYTKGLNWHIHHNRHQFYTSFSKITVIYQVLCSL